MTVALHAVLPPDDSAAVLTDIASALDTDGGAALICADGRQIQLPAQVQEVLREAVRAMTAGQAVSITATETMLTTQAAAGLLGVSRPTLVRLLEAGEIPHVKPGRHRRVALTDLQAYQQRVRQRRRQGLSRMSAEAAELDSFRFADRFPEPTGR